MLVTYPEVRNYMDEDWFANESYPADNEGYFIPSKYLVHTFNKKEYMFPGPINL